MLAPREDRRGQAGYDHDQIEAILHGCVRHTGLRQAYVATPVRYDEPG